jgi:hypothetical protein
MGKEVRITVGLGREKKKNDVARTIGQGELNPVAHYLHDEGGSPVASDSFSSSPLYNLIWGKGQCVDKPHHFLEECVRTTANK